MRRLLFLLIPLLFVSCNEFENKVQGSWGVDQAYYYDEPVIWDLYSNGVNLNKDHTCTLPPINRLYERNQEEEVGVWKVYTANDTSYLQIKTQNRIFNRTFQIHNLRKVRDTISWGYLMKMTLSADSLKLDCTKALYE